jgi:hypothetical protein
MQTQMQMQMQMQHHSQGASPQCTCPSQHLPPQPVAVGSLCEACVARLSVSLGVASMSPSRAR